MSIRVRETYGTSWRDPWRPGVRHWHSSSISYGPGWLGLIGAAIWWLLVLPFLVLPLWLCVEGYVLAGSAVVVLVRWAADPSTRYRAVLRQSWWFWYLSAI